MTKIRRISLWHYRPLKKDGYYYVGEYYLRVGEKKSLWSLEQTPSGESLEELIKVLKMMLHDVKKYKPIDHKTGKIVR